MSSARPTHLYYHQGVAVSVSAALFADQNTFASTEKVGQRLVVQSASIAAWNDEEYVVLNRAMYRGKFATVTPMLSAVIDVALPDAGFYLCTGPRKLQGLGYRIL